MQCIGQCHFFAVSSSMSAGGTKGGLDWAPAKALVRQVDRGQGVEGC